MITGWAGVLTARFVAVSISSCPPPDGNGPLSRWPSACTPERSRHKQAVCVHACMRGPDRVTACRTRVRRRQRHRRQAGRSPRGGQAWREDSGRRLRATARSRSDTSRRRLGRRPGPPESPRRSATCDLGARTDGRFLPRPAQTLSRPRIVRGMLRLGQGRGQRIDQPATRGGIPPFGPSA